MTISTPSRRSQRWKVISAAIILVLILIAVLPWLLTIGPVRSRVVAGLNRAIAPGRLEVAGLHLSWFGPTRLSGVTLLDPQGSVVARVPSAVVDRTFGHWLLGGSGPLEVSLDGTDLNVKRAPDGSINLASALRPLIVSPNPKRDVTVRIVGGSLRYSDPFLAEPATADPFELTLHKPAAPAPITWTVKLTRGDSSLEIQGDFDRWLSRGGAPATPELQVGIVARRWPFVAKTAGLDANGQFDGSLDFVRKRGRWVLSGDARLLGLNARGETLSGDTLAFDRLDAGWDLAEAAEGWTIRRLSVTSPVGSIKAEGQFTGTSGLVKQRIEGRIDLAALAKQIPHTLRLREGLTVDRGTARLAVDMTLIGTHGTYEVEGRVADLAARDRDRVLSLREPATFSARLIHDGEATNLERFAVRTAFLDAFADGAVTSGVRLEANLDLDKFRSQLGEWINLGHVDLTGSVKLTGHYQLRPAGDFKNPSEMNAESQAKGPGFTPAPLLASPHYESRFRVIPRDNYLSGLLDWLLPQTERDLLLISANGPADASGWPLGWDRIGITVGDNLPRLQVELETKAQGVGVSIDAHYLPILKATGLNYQTIMLKGDWSPEGRVLTISEVGVEVAGHWPMEDIPKMSARGRLDLKMRARGRLDLARGELFIDAIPGESQATIVPGTDGIRVSGIGRERSDLRVEGSLTGDAATFDDLIEIWTGRPSLGLSGRWSAVATARGDAEGVQIAGKLGLDPVPGAARPNSMAVRAHYATNGDRIDLSEFTVSTPYGTLDASGRLDDPAGRQQVDLRGTLAPDFGAINAVLASRVEPGARIDGKPRAFRAVGSMGDGSSGGWKGLVAEVGFDLTGADIYGMKFGPSPVVLRSKGGKLLIDPISTSLNEGHIRLEPELDLDAPGGPTLRLAKNSTIREARINDEVSRRVLAYVAPILDRATRVGGLVSVDLDHAEFPIGPGRGRQAKVEGAVVFEDVEFAPGPLASDMLGLIGRNDLTLKLDQPVKLAIADGRITQRGLAVPIGDLTRIELAGWVDFDRNLSLTATLPVTPAMLGNNPLLSDIAAGTQVRLPIGGTLDRPQIDREALTASMKDLSRDLIARGATRGALELLMRMSRPKDPNAVPPPPRPSPEERKAMRQEKKAIRRGEIPAPPPATPER